MSGTSISISINPNDLARIRKKLQSLDAELRSHDGSVFKCLFRITDDYNKTVASVMGVVDANDDLTSISFRPFMGDTATVRWAKLAKKSIRIKRTMGWRLTIWEASGTTKNSLLRTGSKVVTVGGKYEFFAGLSKQDDTEAYMHALAAETGINAATGKQFSPRPLFSVANDLFIRNSGKIIEAIQASVRESITKVW